jgi:hypothetical protein
MSSVTSSRNDVVPTAESPARVVRITARSLLWMVALGLILAAVLLRAWGAMQLSFLGDEWAWIARAADTPFLRYVGAPYNGHLQPGQFALVWGVTRLAPLNYAVAQGVVLAAVFGSGVLMWWFLESLFGPRPGNLAVLVVFLLCPLTVSGTLWWTTALSVVPFQIFLVATLFAVTAFVRAPTTGRLVAAGAVYAGGLLFWEKSVLILPTALLFALLFLGEGTGRARLRSATLGRWRLWAVLGAITAAYVALYLVVVSSPLDNRATPSDLWHLVATMMGSSVVPSLVGGPWAGSPLGVGVLHAASTTVRATAWGLVLAVVAASFVLRRQAWRAWTLALAYLGVCVALVAAGRLDAVGPQIGLSSRYVADAVPVLALALGLTFMTPLDRRADPMWARRSFVIDRGGDGVLPERTRRWTPWVTVAVCGSLSLAFAASASITDVRIAQRGGERSAKAWLAAAKSELVANPTAAVVDSYLPSTAISSAVFPEAAKASRALAPIAPGIGWDAPAEQPLIFDRTGHLRPVAVSAATVADPGPTRACGYLAFDTPVTVPLRRPALAWRWGVEMSYYTDRDADAFVTIDGDRQEVRLLRGVHHLVLIHEGRVPAVTIDTGGSPVCIGSLRVGELSPT